jgi:hypothetical protein
LKNLKTILICISVFLLFNGDAEARRHRKFKGVVIVNQILKLDGTITKNGVDVPEYSGVKQGDVLETGEKSQAVIRIPGLGIFRMGPKTKFILTQFNNRDSSRFSLQNGGLLALFRRFGDHEVILNQGVIKLQGTTFYAISPAGGKIDQVCLCQGKIKVVANESEDAEPTAEPTAPKGTPLFKASLSAEVKPGIVKVEPTAVPTAAPTALPTNPRALEIVSNGEHRQCEISQDGIVMKDKSTLIDLHPDSEIKELESLYALP